MIFLPVDIQQLCGVNAYVSTLFHFGKKFKKEKKISWKRISGKISNVQSDDNKLVKTEEEEDKNGCKTEQNNFGRRPQEKNMRFRWLFN